MTTEQNTIQPEENVQDSQIRHLRWLGWTLFALLVISFIIVIIVLRGLCTEEWYIKLLGLNNKLCSGNSQTGQQAPNDFKPKLTLDGTTLTLANVNGDVNSGSSINLSSILNQSGSGGPTGSVGANGLQGFKGFTGAAGATGATGSPGPADPCATLATFFCQGGNSFGTTAVLGTNDANPLSIRTNGATQASISVTGQTLFKNSSNSTTAFAVQNAASSPILNVDSTNKRVGVNTAMPTTDLHVVGSEIVTGHTAIGPSATLGDGLLVTPLPPPFSSFMARRTQYVAETITDLSTAPPVPAAYVAQGSELLINPSTAPSPTLVFGGAYTAATIAGGNAQNFGTVIGQLDGIVHKGSGTIDSAFASLTGIINLDGGTITNAFGSLHGLNNANPAGIITNDVKVGILQSSNLGTILNSTGVAIIDQAGGFGGTNNPVKAANITTTGAALNAFGGSTFLNAENNAQLTADFQSPYNVATRWTTPVVSSNLPTPVSYMGNGYANGYMYITGGEAVVGTPTTTVYYTKVGTAGKLSWAATTPLPAARSHHRTFIQNGYIYVVGGTDGIGAVSTVYFARLNADGTVGTWRTTTSLPGVREEFGGAQNNGYFYVVSGTDGFTNFPTVFYARPNSDGSISSWTTSANAVPVGYKRADALVANGYLYYLFAGGFGTEFATLNPDGSNGTWTTASNSPVFGTFDHTAFVNSGSLYRIGGSLTPPAPGALTTVSTTPLQANGDLGSWTENVSNLPVPRAGQGLVITDGFVYVIGGYDNVSTVATVYATSTRRVSVAGALDLVTLGSGSLSDGGAATTLTAGNTNVIGALQVYGDTALRGRLAALSDVNFAANTQLGGNINFDAEVAHNIKVGDSITAATAGASLSILGANGNGAAGGNLIFQAGTGTTNGNILLNQTAGNVGIGAAVPAAKLDVTAANGTTGVGVAQFTNTNNTNTSDGVIVTAGSNAGSGAQLMQFKRPDGTIIGSVTQATATTVAFNTTSDQRLKQNIVDTGFGLNTVLAIKVHDYDYKADPDQTKLTGFIAQELYKLFPQAVTVGSDAVDAKGNLTNPWQVDYSKLTPLLTKGIQDINTKVDRVDARLKTLEAGNGTSVDVLAQLASAKAITLNGNLVVNGRVEFSAANKGLVKVPVGTQKFKVNFVSPFGQKPTVVVSPNDFVDGAYKTNNVTTTGFEIDLQKAQPTDLEFNWQGF